MGLIDKVASQLASAGLFLLKGGGAMSSSLSSEHGPHADRLAATTPVEIQRRAFLVALRGLPVVAGVAKSQTQDLRGEAIVSFGLLKMFELSRDIVNFSIAGDFLTDAALIDYVARASRIRS